MTKEQIQALVNKGAITHVGVATECEELDANKVAAKYVTTPEVATEIVSEPEEPKESTKKKSSAKTKSTTKVEEEAPTKVEEEAPTKVEEEAPVVDPVDETEDLETDK